MTAPGAFAETQKRRMMEATREAGASEDEAAFDTSFGRIAKAKSEG